MGPIETLIMESYVNDHTHLIRTYYKDIAPYKILTTEEERKLVKEAKNNNIQSRNLLIQCHLKYVFSIAKRYTGHGVSLDDLIAEGNLGLFKALEMFDETRGVKFVSCAIWWIKYAMHKRVQSTIESKIYEVSTDEKPLPASATAEKCQVDEFDDISAFNQSSLAYNDEDMQFDQIESKKTIINKLLEDLPDRCKFIIKASFGIDMDKMTLQEMGNILHISNERVRKIKDNSIKILRSKALELNEVIN